MPKTWHDPRVPADVDCVLRPLLERRAADTPDKLFARFADGSTWSYRDAREAARKAAVGLRRLTADTWDRAAAGIEVKRERIGATAPGEERRAR